MAPVVEMRGELFTVDFYAAMLAEVDERIAHSDRSCKPYSIGQMTWHLLAATGYGRRLVRQATRQVTEISCHAHGFYHEFAHGGTLVDIGGQDSKVIAINADGKVLDFVMNDKCSAGTGRFLENTANRLQVPLERLGAEALSVTEETGEKVILPRHPQLVGAHGAALVAMEERVTET